MGAKLKAIWKGFWGVWDALWAPVVVVIAIIGYFNANIQIEKLEWLIVLLGLIIIFKVETIMREVKAKQDVHIHLSPKQKGEFRDAFNRS
jgi:hypothetical protein